MIRRVYLEFLRTRGPKWFMRQAARYLGIQAGWRMGRPLTGPALGTLMVTYRCNLHCTMCDMPCIASRYRNNGCDELGTSGMLEIIRQFANLGTPGIGFTGGEPLLRDDIFELIAAVRNHGMISHLNSNGLLITEEVAGRIIRAGTDSVNISLDGPNAAIHDSIRRRAGAFDAATNALSLLVEERRNRGSRIRIKSVTVVTPETAGVMPELVSLAHRLGIDCVEFIPCQPFAAESSREGHPSPLFSGADWNMLVAETGRKAHALGITIENSPAHFSLFPRSFAGLPSPVRCSAAYNSLAVDCYGAIFPCVPWINWQRSVGSIHDAGGLQSFWYANKGDWRTRVGACRECHLNCQTELNLLFDLF